MSGDVVHKQINKLGFAFQGKEVYVEEAKCEQVF